MRAINLMQERSESARILKVLDHPARKRIIELLGTRGAMSWKDLANELGMGTGALYYHMDTLEGIVARDDSKRYTLTKPGRGVYEYLKANPLANSMQSAPFALSSAGGSRRYLVSIFAPRSFLSRILSSDARSTAVLLISSLAFLSVMIYLREGARLFYLTTATGIAAIAGSYALSLLALFLLGYFTTLTFFHVRANPLPLAASSAFSFLPVVLFSMLLPAFPSLSSLLPNRSILTIMLVLFQTWSATILAAGISISSGVRIEKSVVASLIALYATMTIIFLQGTGF